MSIGQLLDKIASSKDCEVLPPKGLPVISADLLLPRDLVEFYERCGGAQIFPKELFGFAIVGPEELIPANPLLLGDFYTRNKRDYDADRSAAWYLLARGTKSNQFVTIDLRRERIGYCYDSFWEVYAKPDSKVVARSFTEFVGRLYEARGIDLYWEHDHFNLGHAYD